MQKTALITGAAKRLGRELAIALHEHGYRVVIHYNRSRDEAESLVGALLQKRPGSALAVGGDLSHPDTPARLVDEVRSVYGRLDVLINNASHYEASSPTDTTLGDWHAIMDLNLRAPFFLCNAALGLLRATRGCIVNLTDIYADRPQRGYAVYCASKAGLVCLTKALATDLAPDIRVNAISPGPILWADNDAPEHRHAVLASTPMQRLGTPGDIAAAAVYLVNADFVTGQILTVDGGRASHL
jgi:pteridine reductase